MFRGTLTIRALVMGDGALCYGALEIVGLLLLLVPNLSRPKSNARLEDPLINSINSASIAPVFFKLSRKR